MSFKHNAAPQINFGKDFEDLQDKQKVVYLKKFSSSMNHAADLIQTERNEAVQKLILQDQQLRNADLNLAQIKASLVKNITDSNAEKQNLLAEIAELKRG